MSYRSNVYVTMRHKLLRQEELAAELQRLDEQIDELRRTGGRPAQRAVDDHTLAKFSELADRLVKHYEAAGWPGQWPLVNP